jgi:L-seryl-tRNA(Ser) seleniumtransferase
MSPSRERKTADPRSFLPAVDRLAAAVADAAPEIPRWAVLSAVRELLARARSRAHESVLPVDSREIALYRQQLVREAMDRAAHLSRVRPSRTINATGIALHTNLGRAPLAPGAVAAACEAAGYADLELDLRSGERGKRESSIAERLVLLSGAEDAHAVNNNAAALLLALDSIAAGREVIVSRGELVEIGGSFRVPEIVARARVKLVEVGTTNRTRAADYAQAIGPETALLLKVHRSNFEVRGFVEEASLEELSALGRARGLPVVEDLGSGTLLDLRGRGFPAESFVPDRLTRGADLVCFSGDKLLGGPQAGILLGRSALIASLRRNPLARALRLDKLSLAALDWTLGAYLDGSAERELPLLQLLLAEPEQLAARAQRIAKAIEAAARGRVAVELRADRGEIGGGTLPGVALATWVVALTAAAGPDALAKALRAASPPIVGRIREDCVLLDVRSITDDDEAWLVRGVEAALDAAR